MNYEIIQVILSTTSFAKSAFLFLEMEEGNSMSVQDITAYLSVCLPVRLFTYIFNYLSDILPIYLPKICLFIRPSILSIEERSSKTTK